MGRVKEKETAFEIEQSIIFGSLDGAKESTKYRFIYFISLHDIRKFTMLFNLLVMKILYSRNRLVAKQDIKGLTKYFNS